MEEAADFGRTMIIIWSDVSLLMVIKDAYVLVFKTLPPLMTIVSIPSDT